ncbi:glutamate formimidoyltransferase [Bdellovibrionota bacterium FG-2]
MSLNTHRLVECVPNFSEGKDPAKIQEIVSSIEAVSGIQLLGVDPGADTHRTVVTFVGSPEAVAEAAFRAIAKAAEVIDMRTHKGAHPRMGATDVCPFVPVEGVSMQECVEIARQVGARVGRELQIPVYLYEEAASHPERSNLADIRRGEYEGFARKIKEPQWKPDFGPSELNLRSGATVIGAREFLVAYNINLNSTDKQHATEIAFELREKGRVGRTGNTKPFYFKGKKMVYSDNHFPCASCAVVTKSLGEVAQHCTQAHHYDLLKLLEANEVDLAEVIGKNAYKPGTFEACKAIGWYVDDYKRAQISINLTHPSLTPPHLVFEEARQLAAQRGLRVTGSEVVGLIPLESLLASGRFYLKKQGKSVGIPTQDILNAAVVSLGLNEVASFDISKKVLGYADPKPQALVQMKVSDFTNEVSRESPAPGGGSIAALGGALCAALASMVANLTHGKEGTETKDPLLEEIADEAQKLKHELLSAVDDDTDAFSAFMEARRLPQGTPEEKTLRTAKMQEGLKLAVEVPWQTAQASFRAMELASKVVELGNPNSLTDGAVGVQVGFTGVQGGIWNVLINLKSIKDEPYCHTKRTQGSELLTRAKKILDGVSAEVDKKLGI